jgi:exodeoxyribonuclease VII small subunit
MPFPFSMAKRSPTPDGEASFETALGRLEEIVEHMEAEKLPLEELLVRYEEGVKLVKFCSEKLTAAEKRIEIITRDAGGEPQLKPFEEGGKPDAAAAAPEGEADVSLF